MKEGMTEHKKILCEDIFDIFCPTTFFQEEEKWKVANRYQVTILKIILTIKLPGQGPDDDNDDADDNDDNDDEDDDADDAEEDTWTGCICQEQLIVFAPDFQRMREIPWSTLTKAAISNHKDIKT